jgi:hypothetical protein
LISYSHSEWENGSRTRPNGISWNNGRGTAFSIFSAQGYEMRFVVEIES